MTGLDSDLDALCDALEGVAAALQSASPKAVLAAEPRLATAVAAFARKRDSNRVIDDPARFRRRVAEGRLALKRCLALGRSTAGLITAAFPSQVTYGREGLLRCAPSTRARLESRS
jgi:hypothetical protein